MDAMKNLEEVVEPYAQSMERLKAKEKEEELDIEE